MWAGRPFTPGPVCLGSPCSPPLRTRLDADFSPTDARNKNRLLVSPPSGRCQPHRWLLRSSPSMFPTGEGAAVRALGPGGREVRGVIGARPCNLAAPQSACLSNGSIPVSSRTPIGRGHLLVWLSPTFFVPWTMLEPNRRYACGGGNYAGSIGKTDSCMNVPQEIGQGKESGSGVGLLARRAGQL